MKKPSPRPAPSRALIEALEKRLLLSADIPALLGVEGLAGAADSSIASRQLEDAETAARRELLVVDAAVEGYEVLVEEVRARAGADLEVVALDPSRDGISQIGELLARYDDLDALHIVSHGSAGEVQLGSERLGAGDLVTRSAEIAAWGDALGRDADVLFYGCELAGGEEGRAFVDRMAALTGADVAASDDLTGAAALGGDWDLEVRRGEVETRALSSAGWNQVLATITVTSNADSGAGTLREAITNAVDGDRIEFALAPGSVITLSNALPSLSANDLVVDGSAGGVPGIVIDGDGEKSNGLSIVGDRVTVRGLVIQDFDYNGIVIHGDDATVVGNYLGTNAAGTAADGNRESGIQIQASNATIGGPNPEDRNVISGNTIHGISIISSSANNTILNNYIGTNASGSAAIANGNDGISVWGTGGNQIGVVGSGNLISGNVDDGIVLNAGSDGNTVVANYIGTDATGLLDVGNNDEGIEIRSSANTIGGSTAGERNVVSGNDDDGIKLTAGAAGNSVAGNHIGADVNGDSGLGNRWVGVKIQNSSGNSIGGTGAGEGNLIVSNDEGVRVRDLGASNAILGNAIHSNATLGINLRASGESGAVVTPNDAGDADGGGNALQNFPVLATAVTNGVDSTQVTGSLDSLANTSFRIELFANNTDEGHGEGEIFLGSGLVTTDGSGNASIDITVAQGAPSASYITATATRLSAGTPVETSEFSQTLLISNIAPAAANDAYVLDEDTTLTVDWVDTAWTARREITFDNSAQGENLVDFPVLVTLNASNFDYAKAQSGGEDLRFFAADGTPLAYEIESWNASGDSHVWVRVPQIAGGSNTGSITMYYGNAGAAAGASPGDVFTGGYSAVYHLNEDPALTGGVIGDSSANGFDGTNQGTTQTSGQFGSAQHFDESSGQYIDLGTDRSFVDGVAQATLSAWVSLDSFTGTDQQIVSLSIQNGSPTSTSRVGFEVSGDEFKAFARSADSTSAEHTAETTGVNITTGTWYHVTVVFDVASDDIEIYVDGVARSLTHVGTFTNSAFPNTPSSSAAIGAEDTGASAYFDGKIEEVRIETGGRSADWIAAEHLAMTGAFVSIGVEESAAATGGVLANDTDAGGDLLSATLGSGPSNAAAFSFNADGTFSYTPLANYSGIDSFTYTVSDGTDTSNVATVTLTVNPVNDTPTTSGIGNVSVSEDAANTVIDLHAAFEDIEDADGAMTYAVVANTNPALFAATLIDAGAGTLTLDYAADQNGTSDLTVRATDSGGEWVEATFTVTVGSVNDAPVVTTSAGALAYTENDAATAVDASLTISDVDSANLTGATVTVSANYANGEDVLAFTDQLGITGSWDAATGVLTLSGSASVADYQTALRTVTYANTSDDPSTAIRTLGFVVNDGTDPGSAATRDVAVSAANDAPVVTSTALPLAYTENAPPAPIDSGLVITDVDSPSLAGATVSLAPLFLPGEDVLGFTDQLGITGSWNALTGVLTLTGSASVSDYQVALRSVTYANTSDAPDVTARSVRVVVDDGTDASAAATRGILVVAVGDAPVLTTTAGVLAYTENAAPVAVDAGLLVVDVDTVSLAGASVSIAAGYAPGEDVLGFSSQAGITGSFDAGTGTLALSGAASVGDYQTALRSVTYQNTSEDPSTAVRTLSLEVNDGALASAAATRDIGVAAVNDAPVVATSAGSIAYSGTAPVAVDPAINLADVDGASLSGATLSVGGYVPGEDVLAFSDQLGITGSFDATSGVLTLSGVASLSDYETALQSVTYTNNQLLPTAGVRTLSFAVNDGGATSLTATRSLSISSVDVDLSDLPDTDLPEPGPVVDPPDEVVDPPELAPVPGAPPQTTSEQVAARPAPPETRVWRPEARVSATPLTATGVPQDREGSVTDSEYVPTEFNPLGRIAAVVDFWDEIDRLEGEMGEDARRGEERRDRLAVLAKQLGVGASAWLVALAARSTTLAATALAALPMWRRVDPLAVLDLSEEEQERRKRELQEVREDEERQNRDASALLDEMRPDGDA